MPWADGAYSITVDQADVVWISAGTGPRVDRYNPAANTWSQAPIPDSSGWSTRGIGSDVTGSVWVAMDGGDAGSRVARVDTATLAATVHDLVSGDAGPVGAGVDFDGNVWTVNRSTSNASRLHIDPVSGNPAPHPATGNEVDIFPTGPNPYTDGDFIGRGLRMMVRPSGEYIVPIQGVWGWLACNLDGGRMGLDRAARERGRDFRPSR